MGPVQQNIMYDLKNVTFFWDINISLSPLTVFFLFLGSGIYFSNTLNLSKWGEEGFFFFYIWNALKSIAITAHLNKLSLSNKLLFTLNPQILAWMIPTSSTQVICAINLVNDWNQDELFLGQLINLAITFQLKSVFNNLISEVLFTYTSVVILSLYDCKRLTACCSVFNQCSEATYARLSFPFPTSVPSQVWFLQ